MRHPPRDGRKRMLAKGLEPSTVRLQGGCSTIELSQRIEVELITKPMIPLNNLFYVCLHHRIFRLFDRLFWLRGQRRQGLLEKEGRDFGSVLGRLGLGHRSWSENLRMKLLAPAFFFTAFFILFPRTARAGIVTSNFCHCFL